MSSVAKQKQESRPGFVSELFRGSLYKPNQGRVVRQVTFATVVLLGCLAAWEFAASSFFSGVGAGRWGIGVGVAAVIAWVAFRLVNYSVFADFLVAVEAEMNKVSWPSRKELWNASLVVIFVIFSMALFLFLFDALWTIVFELLGIRYSEGGSLLGRLFEFFGLR